MINFDEFYKQRVEHFGDERKIFQDYSALVGISQLEQRKLEWNIKQLDESRREKELFHENLDFQQRKLKDDLLNATEEIKQLKRIKQVRMDQIHRLSILSQPVENDTAYIIEDKVGITKTKKKSKEIEYENVALGKVLDNDASFINKINGFKQTKTGEIVMLEDKIRKETVTATAYGSDVRNDVDEAIREFNLEQISTSLTHSNIFDECYAAVSLLSSNEYQNFLAVSELLKLRLKIMIAQREEMDELERLHKDKEYFHAKEEKTKEKLLFDMKTAKSNSECELKERVDTYKSQLEELNSKIENLTVREVSLQDKKSTTNRKTEKLNIELEQVKERFIKLRRRNSLEMEGYVNDVKQLRSQLKYLEKIYITQNHHRHN
eukprot:gene12012-16080_t